MKLTDRQRAIISDVMLGVGMFALSIGSIKVWEPGDPTQVRPVDFWAYLLIGLQTLPLIWRRRAPLPVLTVTILSFMIDRGVNYPGSWAFFGISFAIYTVGAQIEPRRSLIIGGLAIDLVLIWTGIGILVYDVEEFALITELAILGFPLLVGREAYLRQQRMLHFEARALRAEHERGQRAADAVLNERIRISRELHDVVAHEITVMTIQSAAARRIIDSDKDKAVSAIKTAEAAGHRALTEIRRLLGMLRTTDPKAVDPQPGLGAIESLVEQMQMAGLSTKVSVTGNPRELPLGIDLNAYRIIQESLTNTLKHGGPNAHAEIDIVYGDHTLSVAVNDDGRGAAAGRGGAGQGLVGMRERAALLHGSVSAGPRPGGGYRVAAQIPIPES
jgi:signal transduction histidine kinase